MKKNKSNPIVVQRLVDSNSTNFEKLYEIYQSSINSSEQKPKDEIAKMPTRPDYLVLVGLIENQVVGFTITYLNPHAEFSLLEYMAVQSQVRNQGLGSQMYQATFEFLKNLKEFSYLMIEVDTPEDTNSDQDLNARRIDFYLRNGGAVIANFDYILPLKTNGVPPEMQLMTHRLKPFAQMTKPMLIKIVTVIYTNVYKCLETDFRLFKMFKSITDPISFNSVKTHLQKTNIK